MSSGLSNPSLTLYQRYGEAWRREALSARERNPLKEWAGAGTGEVYFSSSLFRLL